MANLFNVSSFLFFFLYGLFSFAAQPTELKIVGDYWCPFTCSSKSERPGFLIEIMKEIMEPDFKLIYEEASWSRAINETRSGKFTAIAGAMKSDAPDFVYTLSPLAYQKSCLFVAPDSKWIYKNNSSFSSVVLGAVADYSYGQPVDEYIQSYKKNSNKIDLITGENTAERLLKKLKDNRNDVMVEDLSVVNYLRVHQADFKNFNPKSVFCQKPQPLYVAFSPSNMNLAKEYARKLDEGFAKFKETPKYQKLLSRYGMVKSK